jgi:Rhodanese-like domain
VRHASYVMSIEKELMSYRSPKKVRRGKPAPMRGPSRPINPRYAPGGPPKRRIDSFGIGLIVVSGLVVVALLLVIALQNRGGQTTQAINFPTPLPDLTKTAVMFATQTAPDALPRITVQEAKALYDVGDIKIIDVRDEQFYNQGHIKGAVNVPQAQVQTKLSEFPKTGNVALYCQ